MKKILKNLLWRAETSRTVVLLVFCIVTIYWVVRASFLPGSINISPTVVHGNVNLLKGDPELSCSTPSKASTNPDGDQEKGNVFNAAFYIVTDKRTVDMNEVVEIVIISNKFDTKTSVWSELLTGPRLDRK